MEDLVPIGIRRYPEAPQSGAEASSRSLGPISMIPWPHTTGSSLAPLSAVCLSLVETPAGKRATGKKRGSNRPRPVWLQVLPPQVSCTLTQRRSRWESTTALRMRISS